MVENNSLLVVDEIPPYNMFTQRFSQHFTEAPCRCCGSSDHGLLKWTPTEDRHNNIEYTCPITQHQHDLTHLDMTNIVIFTHLACPEKMVKHCKYKFGNIHRALETYRESGAGRWMTTEEIDSFKKRVLQYHIYYHQGKNDEKRHRTLFFTPCRICGQQDHPMLHPYINEDGIITYHYSCPVAACENWKEACKYEDRSKKYDLCPQKFAQVNNYSYNEVHTALETCRVHGNGKFLDIETFRTLRQQIVQICAFKSQEDQPKRLGLLAHVAIIFISIVIMIGISITLTHKGSQL